MPLLLNLPLENLHMENHLTKELLPHQNMFAIEQLHQLRPALYKHIKMHLLQVMVKESSHLK